MKTFAKYLLFCGTALAFWACGNHTNDSSSSGGGMPVMDNRVVSYQKAGWSSELGSSGIIDNIDTLKSWFPNDLNEQGECNYFAIFKATNSTRTGYLVLAQDMILYSLVPNLALSDRCMETEDIFYDVMLVCDDKANTFKNNIKLNGTYTVPNWNCTDGRTAPEQGFFPITRLLLL